MRSHNLKRHIGLMHGLKATKQQQAAAVKAREDKWCACPKCDAIMLKKNKVRHLRTCTGQTVFVEDDETGGRNIVKRGSKSKADKAKAAEPEPRIELEEPLPRLTKDADVEDFKLDWK